MKSLFDISKIKNMSLKNRFFRGALWEDLADEKGNLTEELENIYIDLAKGGVGTIITGYAFVLEEEQPNPGMMGIYNDSFINQYKKFTDKVHEYNANIVMQIVYGGFMTDFNVGERVIFGPSNTKNEVSGAFSKEMTKDEINYVVNSFAEAGLRVKKSGFDGVQIHCAHGYLLSQFLSPYYNKRDDEYGGSIENRARIVFEVFKAIREKVGQNFPIMIKLQSSDCIEDIISKEAGLTQDESIYVAKRLEELGIDAIEVSGGNACIKEVLKNNLGASRRGVANESYFKDYAVKLSKEIKIPVILIGGNRNFNNMTEILNESNIEYFSLARPLTAEPNLINIWNSGDLKKAKCVSCNGCFKTHGKRCILNK